MAEALPIPPNARIVQLVYRVPPEAGPISMAARVKWLRTLLRGSGE